LRDLLKRTIRNLFEVLFVLMVLMIIGSSLFLLINFIEIVVIK
tara:strand:+ start:3816 stop:3944 length:129 start_codon:yes stop_codon:yes gene_type:complete